MTNCHECGLPMDPELRDLLQRLRALGDQSERHTIVGEEMNAALSRCQVKKSKRPHVELVLHHFYTGLIRRSGLSASAKP